jgi:hypothetical protein
VITVHCVMRRHPFFDVVDTYSAAPITPVTSAPQKSIIKQNMMTAMARERRRQRKHMGKKTYSQVNR